MLRAMPTASSASRERVHAAKLGEHAIVERLDAERDAVDAGGAVAAEAGGFDAGRIGFEADLDVGRNAPMFCDRIEDRATVAGCISEGVPPPKKIVETVRSGTRAAVAAISAAKARTKRGSSIGSRRTWLLKSQ